MALDQPSILIVDDSSHFRRYLSLTFSRAAWLVYQWDPQDAGLEFIDTFNCDTLTAVVADWQLGPSFNGLEVLTAVRKTNDQVACVLYSTRAFEGEWRRVSATARESGILTLDAGSVSPPAIHDAVVAEVRRIQRTFEEPRQIWQDYETWILPESEDQRLAQAIDAVGKEHVLAIIHSLFPERGPQRPIAYGFLTPGFSGARVFQLKDPIGTPTPGPRYILKVAQGNTGFQSLQSERLGFHELIQGGGTEPPKLVGYVADEIRPSMEHNEPASADDAWFGIAYKEVGNGVGPVLSFKQLYLQDGPSSDWNRRRQDLSHFLNRLYSDCLGNWFHHAAHSVTRKLWAETGAEPSCYSLSVSKQFEILTALDELQPRARALLGRVTEANAADRITSDIVAFIREGRCGRPYGEPTFFHRVFETLQSGTHNDLHAGNVLAIERQGQSDPFLIDFTEFQHAGHPFYDYARMENDIRLRLMNCEDGSDILDEMLLQWLEREASLLNDAETDWLPPSLELHSSGAHAFAEKGYAFIGVIRALAYQNLTARLRDQKARPSPQSFRLQYTTALLHRTLISLASSDIVPHKKILALWLSAKLIARLGALLSAH